LALARKKFKAVVETKLPLHCRRGNSRVRGSAGRYVSLKEEAVRIRLELLLPDVTIAEVVMFLLGRVLCELEKVLGVHGISLGKSE
jgi:hypothetical protein